MNSVYDAFKDGEIKNALRIDSDAVSNRLDELVRSTVADTLNRLLDAEADQFCNAKR
jgi:putative transposase